MSWFGKKETDAEVTRKQNREITRAQRQVTRTTTDMEREEKKIEAQIKAAAKKGDMQTCQVLAKQLVALRKQKTRTIATNSRIGAMGAQAKAMNANVVVAGAIGTATAALKSANATMNAERVASILSQFERENAQMDMKEEMMDEALDSILNDSDDEAESTAIMNSVLDEIGIEVNEKLSKVTAPSGSVATVTGARVTDADIEKMLAGVSGDKKAVQH